MSDETELTPKQQAALLALLTEPTIEAAAVKAKASPRSLHAWLRDPRFRRRLRDARGVQLEVVVLGLQQAAADAVAALKRNLACGRPHVEVQAAVTILDKAIHAQAMADITSELEDLRAELRRRDDTDAAAGGSGETSGGDHPTEAAEGPGRVEPQAGRPAIGPGVPVPRAGPGAGPVAGGVPGGPVPPAGPAVLPPGGEEPDQRGEDLDALFGGP